MLSSERGYSVIEKIKAEGFEEGFKIGYEEGFKIGYKIGFEEGFKIGYEEGLKEARMEDAVKMIAAGFPSSAIADITEMPIEEIEKLSVRS